MLNVHCSTVSRMCEWLKVKENEIEHRFGSLVSLSFLTSLAKNI